MGKKRIIVAIIAFISFCTILISSVYAQRIPNIGGEPGEEAPDWVQRAGQAVLDGILVDPGIQTVCFNSERPGLHNGHDFKPLPPNTSVKVTITGNCPFDSGCHLYRTIEGNVMTTVNGSRKPSLQEPTRDPKAPYALGNKEAPVDLGIVIPKTPPGETFTRQIVERGLENHRMYFYIGRGTNTASTEVQTEIDSPTVEPGNANSLNQGVLDFNETSVVITPGSGQSQQCKFIVWDPFGRIFDSQSLEPIPQSTVTLVDAETDMPAAQIDANYDITLADGLFNILVGKPGMYKIRVNPPTTHEVRSKLTLARGYESMYFELYEPETVYEEKLGIPTHHDIAVAPITTPYEAPFVETMKVDSGTHMGKSLFYKGRVSHPRAHVCLFGEQTKINYGCDEDDADAFGVYLIFIQTKDAPLFERLVPVSTKYNQSAPGKTSDIEHAIASKMAYEPVLGYVDGYAYDTDGSLIPFARIQVKLSSTDQVVTEGTADDSGYFSIPSGALPIMGYYFEFTSPQTGQRIRQTTTMFTTSNKDYLTANKLDLIEQTNKRSSKGVNMKKFVKSSPTPVQNMVPQTTTFEGLSIIIAILTCVFILIIAFILYFRSRKGGL